jgi:putative RNA 2'-phosphotransferase
MTTGKIDPKQLSKTLAHALRHAPEEYNLTLDPEGWVGLDDLLAARGPTSRAKTSKT